MRDECIAAVAKALGRQITAAESRQIEQRIATAMRRAARSDPDAWSRLTTSDRIVQAGAMAASELVHEKTLKQEREALSILAQARIHTHIADSAKRGIGPLDALDRLIAFKADGKSNALSVETLAKATERDALRQMLTTLEASHAKFFGLFENQEGIKAILQELFGENSGKAEAKAGAEEFQRQARNLRERFNRAGGDIPEREDWGLPHHHSQMRVAKAGKDAWVQDVLPRLKREAYFNPDGTRMAEPDLIKFLESAWETIATGGANKLDPGQFRASGMRANRGSEARQIHFATADDYFEYQKQYGERSLYEVLVGHIAHISKDVALVEALGPNPDHTFNYLRESIVQDQLLSDPTKAGKLKDKAAKVTRLYNVVAGKTEPVGSEHLAATFDTLRNWLVAARLGSSIITSFSDDATLHLTAKVNNLPDMQVLANELAALNPANKLEERLALRAGLAMNTLLSSLNRFGQDGLGSSFSSKLANTVLRASGLNAITEARRRAFGVTMMSSLGSIAKEHSTLDKLDPSDHRILLSKGITAEDWAVWRKAKAENWGKGNKTVLTPESIYQIPDAELAHLGDPATLKAQAATRLLGIVLEETDVAVVEPGARERAQTGGGLQRGTMKGELTRSFFLFKSFPLAMLQRHWVRGMSYPNHGGKAAYIATLLASTTVLGMASLQIEQLLQGKDPRHMNLAANGGIRNWIAAALKGGSLGIYGDFLFSDSTRYGSSPMATATGPVLGLGEDLFNLTQGNIVQALQGKNTHLGAEVVKFVRGNLPGASLWYAKGALDHLIFHRLQEMFSPGYLSTIRARTQRDFGQSYWWRPGEVTPDRAPDMTAAIGN